MARKPRIDLAGFLYHVTVRGNNKEDIFLDEGDMERFIRILKIAKKRYQFTQYGFALLPNHFHLLLRPSGDGTLSKSMQSINTGYTMYFNRKYERCGHVFQGRYKSILVEEEPHLLELVRYIHLNPVRAGLTQRPEDHRFSSYQIYLGEADNNLIDEEAFQEVLSRFGRTKETQLRRFRSFVGESRKRNVYKPKDFMEDVFLGSEKFRNEAITAIKKSKQQLNPHEEV